MIQKAYKLLNSYVYGRFISKQSPAAFWYLPETPTIVDDETLALYYDSANPSPYYVTDYTKKLSYQCKNKDGIIVLNYGEPFGTQINPEAAFQYALGLHDMYFRTNQIFYKDEFMKYVDYFYSLQTAEGHWLYCFDFFTTNGYWASALAQSRGCSVMLRAWAITGNTKYLKSAEKSIESFNVSVEDGGFLNEFHLVPGCFYFEEYPQIKTAVMNGFMSSLFCLWELSQWADNKLAYKLWVEGIHSLERMLPYYTLSWWSVYDKNPNISINNYNSSRYHLLEIYYLKILSTISNSGILKQYLEKRKNQYNIQNRLKASIYKTVYKLRYM
jgi:hypothetical protein